MGEARTGGFDIGVVVKTLRGMENVAAARILEVLPDAKVEARPRGYLGIVLVRGVKDPIEAARAIEDVVLEAERVLPVLSCVEAKPQVIAEEAAKLARSLISPNETFAVRTVRRGRHDFTSVDVNVVVGDAVRRAVGADVNLTEPDKIVYVEIFDEEAAISIRPGSLEYRKLPSWKKPVLGYLAKISLVQMPYLGPLDASKAMGIRIGRAAQTFEVGELVIAPVRIVDAEPLLSFLKGVFEGIESRYRIQRRSYSRKVRKVPVRLQDLYQLVRDRLREPIIVFEPEGDLVAKRVSEIKELFNDPKVKRINVLVGAREGIPRGIYRYATMVLDLSPGVTISTDFAASSAIIALITAILMD